MSQAFVILFVSISIQGHCFQEVQSYILCQSAVMHALSLLWSDKMIGRGWEVGIIQRVAPAGCNQRPPELFDIQRSRRSWPPLSCPITSLSPVTTLLTKKKIWLADFMFEPESNYWVMLKNTCGRTTSHLLLSQWFRWLLVGATLDLSDWFPVGLFFVVVLLCWCV